VRCGEGGARNRVERVERQLVSGARAGRRRATWEIWAARCAYDFVKPRLRRDAGTACLSRGGVTKIVRVIFVSGGWVVDFFLDAILGGSAGEEVGGAECWAWWREVSRVGAIAMGLLESAFCG
jgi:hypothetical protein